MNHEQRMLQSIVDALNEGKPMTREEVKQAADASWNQGQLEPTPVAETWAKVELMGHVCHGGRLSEEEKFGGKIGRVDVPGQDGSFTTIYFGHASVYQITLVSEAVARQVARTHQPAPVSPWDYPKALSAPALEDVEPAHEYCDDCSLPVEDCQCDDSEDEDSPY